MFARKCLRNLLHHRVRHLHLTQSYVQGPTHIPLDSRTLPAYWNDEILGRYATRPALVARQEHPRVHAGPLSAVQRVNRLGEKECLRWDFEEMDRHVGALARGLVAMGVQPGDRVGVIMGNNSAYAMLQWACAMTGAILVTINPAYRLNELVSTLSLVGVKHLFIVPCIRSSSYLEMFAEAFPALRNSPPCAIEEPALPDLRNLVVFDGDYQNATNTPTNLDTIRETLGIRSAADWREILLWQDGGAESNRVKALISNQQASDIINLQFTSGTTGLPKAVSLTHTNLLNNGLSIGRSMRLTQEDILCNVPPLFHCFERATALHGVPTHFYGVLAEVDQRRKQGATMDFGRLRTGVAAGSPIPIELMKNLISKINLRELTNAYGMTETSPVSFQTTPADSILKRVETVGKVHPHVTAKVVDEAGKVVPIGAPGEIVVSGYVLQRGYWNDPEQTDQVMRFEDDTLWMYTGDEGIMDEEGYLRIVGRKKDIIIRGGENLFPVQIENALTSNHDIVEAAAVAVPDVKYGEVVGAFVVRSSHEGSQSLSRQDVRQTVTKSMNPQNAPAWVWFVGKGEDIDELPKTASGKVMKHLLRDWAKDLVKRNIGQVKR